MKTENRESGLDSKKRKSLKSQKKRKKGRKNDLDLTRKKKTKKERESTAAPLQNKNARNANQRKQKNIQSPLRIDVDYGLWFVHITICAIMLALWFLSSEELPPESRSASA